MHARLRAFTLVETLVVMVLLALVTTMLTQLLGQTLMIRSRLVAVEYAQRDRLLLNKWIESSVTGAMPGTVVSKASFTGDAGQVQFLSTFRLSQRQLTPGVVSWFLRRDGDTQHLFYRNDDASEWLMQRDVGNAEFSFLGADRRWYQQWPPRDQAAANVLPEAVRLALTVEGKPQVWLFVVPGRKEPLRFTEFQGL